MITAAVKIEGLLQRIELCNTIRFHFFADKITHSEDDDGESYPHNHKQILCAKIIQGGYRHSIYEVDEEARKQPAFALTSEGFKSVPKFVGLRLFS